MSAENAALLAGAAGGLPNLSLAGGAGGIGGSSSASADGDNMFHNKTGGNVFNRGFNVDLNEVPLPVWIVGGLAVTLFGLAAIKRAK